jgi:hypothetical protein
MLATLQEESKELKDIFHNNNNNNNISNNNISNNNINNNNLNNKNSSWIIRPLREKPKLVQSE